MDDETEDRPEVRTMSALRDLALNPPATLAEMRAAVGMTAPKRFHHLVDTCLAGVIAEDARGRRMFLSNNGTSVLGTTGRDKGALLEKVIAFAREKGITEIAEADPDRVYRCLAGKAGAIRKRAKEMPPVPERGA